MERQEWLERRRKGIGGSDAGAILGLSRYRSPVDVWLDKTGRSELDPAVGAPAKWGLRLEDAIAAAYTEETGRPVRKVGFRRLRKRPVVIGTPDRITRGLAGKGRLVELKAPRSDDAWAPRGRELELPPTERIPPVHYVQVQHYLGLTGLEVADVAALFHGSDFRTFEIPADPAYIADLFDEEERWWRAHVVADVEPAVGPDDAAYLARKYRYSQEEETIATSEIALAVDDLLLAIATMDQAERERDALENRIKEYMGTAAKLTAPAGTVLWRTHERTTVGWREVAGAYRAILDQILDELAPMGPVREVINAKLGIESLDTIASLYTQTNTVRPFRITRRKEG